MNSKKKNQANQLARECMVTALMQLLEEKTLSEISVSEITKRAGVSRMTYYRNYEKKEDIFAEYLSEVIENYYIESEQMTGIENYYEKKNLIHCFEYFQQHRQFIQCLLKSGMSHMFLDAIHVYVLKKWYEDEMGRTAYYRLEAFCGSLYNVYLRWTSEGAKETPEQLAEILYEIYKK